MTVEQLSVTSEPTRRPSRYRRLRDGAPLRTDIEGLRAIAVGAVILYHADVSLFAGGYVGVDVFFVISGFLITSRLVRDASLGLGVSIRDFYARRMRRIVPMATVVMLATLAISAISQNRLDLLRSTGPDARAAAWFVSNVRFAQLETTYLAESGPVSFFQQFWSLSVEEQFYVLWPLVMLVIVGVARRSGLSVRPLSGAFLAVLVIVSLLVSVDMAHDDPINAFYLLQSRAWELGVGASVAVAAPMLARLPRRICKWLVVLGLAAVAMSILAYSSSTTWPGLHAALPVGGSAAVIVAGLNGPIGVVNRALAWSPIQAMGRYSYSLYLWHWPLIVYAQERRHSQFAVLLAIASTVVLSIASFRLIENPIRIAPTLLARPMASIGLGACLILVATVASFVLVPLVGDLETGRPAPAAAHRVGMPIVATDFVPSDLSPKLADGTSEADPNAERNVTCRVLGQCSYGPRAAPARVVLFGDSHAGHWAPALSVLADQRDWRVERLTTGGCDWLVRRSTPPECRTWIDETWTQIARLQPDLLVLSASLGELPPNDDAAFRSAVVRWIRRAPPGTPVAVISGTPVAEEKVPQCLAAHLDNTRPCEPEPSDEWLQHLNVQLEAATREAGAVFVDVTPMVCTPDRCPAIAGNILVYRDEKHFTSAFVRSRAQDLGVLLTAALDSRAKATA